MSPTDSQPKPAPAPNSTTRSPLRLIQDATQDTLTLARLFVETLISPLTDPSSWTQAPSPSVSSGGGSRLGGGGGWFGGNGGSGRGPSSGGGGRRLGTIAGLNGSGSEWFRLSSSITLHS
ncbi:hypothetical protein NCC49_001930 [Naganishia albida]|nr:hypothetical protein NCC49_001930 [Naganishia albida]